MQRWLFISLIPLLCWSCEDTNRRSSVPGAKVEYTLNITTEYPHFVPDNGFQTMTITQAQFRYEYVGYAGLLIWVDMDAKYNAADLCCPNCIRRDKPVEIEGFYAICPICNEHFDLSYGYAMPTKGKTKESLRKYQVLLQENSIRIIN